MGQTFTVPKIQNGPATAATFNAPLEYIQSALNGLQQNLQQANTSSAVIQWETPVASNVAAGDLVYFNSSTGLFQKALAALSDQIGASGQSIEAASCRVQGIILSLGSTQNSAVMLRSGYYVSDVVLGAIGVGAQAGTYYLSTETAGKATATPGWEVRLPVISYYGDGKFTMISNYYAHIGDGDSVVRSIRSASLQVSNSSGAVTIEQPTRTIQEPAAADFAVSAITNNTLAMTPIVSGLLNGVGIKTTYTGRGIWRISMDSILDKPLAASDFTLNGAQRVADQLLTYTVFPSGSSTSVVMTMPVNFVSNSPFNGSIKLWATMRGPGMGTINAEVYWLPYSSSPITIASSQIGTASMSANNNSTTQLKYIESGSIPNVQIASSGALVAKLTVNTPTYDVYMHEAGFKLELNESSDAQSDAGGVTEQEVIDILERYLVFNPNYSES